MWIGYDEQNPNTNNIFLIMGKALRLCQNFEENISHIVSTIKLEQGIKTGAIKDMFDDNWNKVIKQLQKYFLSNKIKEIEKTRMVSNKVIKKLENGKTARNNIIHDGLRILSGSICKCRIQHEELEEYLKEIEDVAKADNIVSGWIYRMNEKEPPFKSEKQYVEEIKRWIVDR